MRVKAGLDYLVYLETVEPGTPMGTDRLTKVVAEVIANCIPDAFAQPATSRLARVRFDLDGDFSSRERAAFLSLADEILAVLAETRERNEP
ncbi:hypothetical protein ABEG18_19945 [Alsobacter sp. KACC 23698]|uniref:Uncharacterized protein n=1 Tax=Alsobacter sp. KACC 23698 TaxID=3149229 RepID=A0AAU7JCH4_9HYPH